MNKATGILAGIIVVAAAATVGGAWYTGTQLEPVLSTAITQANRELAASFNVDGQPGMQIELLSLDRRFFTSTAPTASDSTTCRATVDLKAASCCWSITSNTGHCHGRTSRPSGSCR